MRMRQTVSCGLPDSTISMLSHKRHDFRGGRGLLNVDVFWFSLQILSETLLILRRTEQDKIKNEISWQISEKYSNIKFHENPPSGSRVVPCGRTDRQTDMTKLIVTFRNYTNAPKKEMVCVSYINMKERKDPASIKAKNNNFQTPCLQAGERKNLLIHKY